MKRCKATWLGIEGFTAIGQILNTLQLLTAKPLIFLLNLSEEDFIKKKNKWLPKVPLRRTTT